jgi:hypothetical protein
MTGATDLEVVARQIGRTPRPFLGVAARCPAGLPIVVEQPARDADGSPFPTTFWLTCPGLVAAIGRLEDAGGVSSLEERVAADASLRASYAQARRDQVTLRPALGDLGIGGTRRDGAIKCLHAHAAYALARPGYVLGEAILAEAGGIPGTCCMEPA